MQKLVTRVPVSDQVLGYAWALVRATRPGTEGGPGVRQPLVSWGAGPRGVLTLVTCAKARAILYGRYHATVADVQAVAKPALRHRIAGNYAAQANGLNSEKLIDMLFEAVPADQASTRSPPRNGRFVTCLESLTNRSTARQVANLPHFVAMAKSILSRYLDPDVLSHVADRHLEPQGLVIGNLAGRTSRRWRGLRSSSPGTASMCRATIPSTSIGGSISRATSTSSSNTSWRRISSATWCSTSARRCATAKAASRSCSTPPRWRWTLGYSVIRQSDKVSLFTFDDRVRGIRHAQQLDGPGRADDRAPRRDRSGRKDGAGRPA